MVEVLHLWVLSRPPFAPPSEDTLRTLRRPRVPPETLRATFENASNDRDETKLLGMGMRSILFENLPNALLSTLVEGPTKTILKPTKTRWK